MDKNAFEKKYNTVGVNIFQTHQLFCQDVLQLRPGELGIVSNGKVSRKSSCSLFSWTRARGVSDVSVSRHTCYSTCGGRDS